jgi:hypothetical protein
VKQSLTAFSERCVLTGVLFGAFCIARPGSAQDLSPRAYVVTPIGSSAVTATYSNNRGSVSVDPSIPLEDFRVNFHTQALSYYYSFGTFSRSSNITVLVPYALGNFSATVADTEGSLYRSGLADSRVRFAVNLWGGPAIRAKEYLGWKERGLLGVSLTLLVPTGQYDPARLINTGSNRWGFKPELGLSRRWAQRWVLDSYVAGWFFTPNNYYFPGTSLRTQAPFFALEAHLSYYAKPRMWISADGNFWNGGRSTLNGVGGNDLQRNSRAGVTVALPMNRHQALKFSYSRGAYVTIGGDYRTISAAWQYSWLAGKE